jgi:hypothetical protein
VALPEHQGTALVLLQAVLPSPGHSFKSGVDALGVIWGLSPTSPIRLRWGELLRCK